MTPDDVTGRDTPTGTDPDAKYEQPGYEDKSLGQAVAQDRALVDRLMEEEDGDAAAAEARFATESAGAPAADAHLTGEAEAERNRAEDPPA